MSNSPSVSNVLKVVGLLLYVHVCNVVEGLLMCVVPSSALLNLTRGHVIMLQNLR